MKILREILRRFILEFEIFFNKSHFGIVEKDYTCSFQKRAFIPAEFVESNRGIEVNLSNENYWSNSYVEGLTSKGKKTTKTYEIFQISKMDIKGSKIYFPKFIIQLDCS